MTLPEGFISILDSIEDSIIVFDASDHVTYTNSPMRTLLGIDPVNLDTNTIRDRFSFVEQNGNSLHLKDLIGRAHENDFPKARIACEIITDKTRMPFECCVMQLVGEGNASGTVFTFRRSDRHPETGGTAAGERSRLLRILDSIEDGIYICSDNFEVEYANPAILAQFGNPAGKLCFDYLYGRESRCPWCRGDEVFGGKTVHWEWRDPETGKVYDIIDTPLANTDGTISKLKVFHDITEKKEEEQKLLLSKTRLESELVTINAELGKSNELLREKLEDLREKDKQLRSQSEILEKVFTNTHVLIAFLGPGFDFIRVNKAWSDADGRNPSFFSGTDYFSAYPDEDARKIFEKVTRSGTQFTGYGRSFPFPKTGEQGSTYWDWSLQPVKNEAGATEGLILTLIDVTKKTEAEKELAETRAALADSKRLSDIGTLAATVAHELRNPLGVIQAAVYNIKRKSREEALVSHITNIENKLTDSERIISNLLNYSSIKQPKPKSIHLYFFIDECIDTIIEQYGTQPVTVIKSFDAFRNTSINIDPFQIREVLMNILHNAYQAIPEKGGSIEVRGALKDGNMVSISISDNGEGIDQLDMDKLFNPFFTRKSKGTGLGLTICMELVKLHRGEIGIESEKGKGTIVNITLPLQSTEQ
jgi:two-component system sporulation sensor kinase C